jgi:chromosome segregation ATPase
LVDFLIATIIGVLLATTAGAAIQYYRLIRRAQRDYEKAKEVVEDVVLSFSRELERETGKIDMIAYRIEGNASKIDSGIKRIESFEKRISPIAEQINAIAESNQSVTTTMTEDKAKIDKIEDAQSKLKAQIVTLEEQVQKFSAAPEIKSEPVILIKRDKAMAALTDTEISVLEMLSTEGAKTAPEIKERIQLSREHTARLMKKLYEEGYLERETGKIPFRYSVKKEMEKLLRKPESTQV